MSDHRVLVEPGTLRLGVTVQVEDEEAHHLRVRRAEAGQGVKLFDGAGVTARGGLAEAGKGWQVTVEEVTDHPATPDLILAVGAGDRDRFLSLAEKCTELGVTRLIPLLTERSAAVATRLRDSGVERARKRAREACKQSANPWATIVDEVTALAALADRAIGGRWLLADPHGAPVASIAVAPPVGWLIGPEGGFTEAELVVVREQLAAASVRLGRHVLRFETAAIAAAVTGRRE
jgi:16S rRNA (uracil1498-N3)-methyltransferase